MAREVGSFRSDNTSFRSVRYSARSQTAAIEHIFLFLACARGSLPGRPLCCGALCGHMAGVGGQERGREAGKGAVIRMRSEGVDAIAEGVNPGEEVSREETQLPLPPQLGRSVAVFPPGRGFARATVMHKLQFAGQVLRGVEPGTADDQPGLTVGCLHGLRHLAQTEWVEWPGPLTEILRGQRRGRRWAVAGGKTGGGAWAGGRAAPRGGG